jgi:D-alanyl-D-alanine endopeptidase (penicillin-binding protein 7)
MVNAAAQYPLIREYTTTPAHYVEVQPTGQWLGFNNSNALVKNVAWDIQLQKTGYIREAGRCVVMLATIASRPMVIVLLDSLGKYTRLGDAQRIKHWLETGESLPRPTVKAVRVKHPVARPVKGSFAPKLASN